MSAPTNDWRTRALAAEETVRVLKRKVLAMHDGGPQTALHRALAKARQREERNAHRREVLEARAAQLAESNQRLEREVERRTAAIQAILDNVTFGFLRIDADLRVLEGFTRSCAELFGRAPSVGASLPDLLDLDARWETQLRLGIEQVFEDLLPEEVTLAQVPARYEKAGRVLQLEGRAIRDAGGAVESILLTVSDVTALEEAHRESRQRDVLIGVLRQRHAFAQFVADTRRGLESCLAALDDGEIVRRFVHTVKGNASSWGLDGLTALAHGIEESDSIDADDVDALRRELVAFLGENRELVGVDYEATEPSFNVSASRLDELRELARAHAGLDAVENWVAEVVLRPARELFGPSETFVGKLAERLGKEVDLAIEGGDVLVDVERMRPVLNTLPHLLRNALDHGIEPAWERGDKPERGRLEVALADAGDRWALEVRDDGRGIQVDALVGRAVERGLVGAEEAGALGRAERLELIFADGLSTAPATTEVSGRGLGMPAVREAAEAQGGAVSVESGGRGTTVRVEVPKAVESMSRRARPRAA